MRTPQRVADNYCRRRIGAIVVVGKRPAHLRPHVEDIEIVWCYTLAAYRTLVRSFTQVRAVCAKANRVGEGRMHHPQLAVLPQLRDVEIAFGHCNVDVSQFPGTGNVWLREDQRVNEGEDGGVDANGECENEDANGREAGTACESSNRVPYVLPERVHDDLLRATKRDPK